MLVNVDGPSMGVGMKHISDHAGRSDVSRAASLDVPRAASSCDSDIDRQELITNYASDKYLSKWSLDLEEDGPKFEVEVTVTPKPPNESPAPDKPHKVPVHDGLKRPSVDADNASLVSYNSVRDGTPTVVGSDTPKPEVPSSYLPYQLVQSPNHSISMWQGYSGNIYFDPVRCQSMMINTSKPCKTKTETHHRKAKSCSPSLEQHRTYQNTSPMFATHHSYDTLGSLRFAMHGKKKGKQYSDTSHYYSGRILKGFSENNLKEAHYDFPRHTRSESAPESLAIAGDQVIDGLVDPIDNVRRHNIKSRLSSKSKDSDIYGGGSFPSLVLGRKWPLKQKKDQLDYLYGHNVKFPGLESSVGAYSETESSSSRDGTEAKAVFIIPFGSFDDPVESNGKGKLKKTPKVHSNTEEKGNRMCETSKTILQVAHTNDARDDDSAEMNTSNDKPKAAEPTAHELAEESSRQSTHGQVANQSTHGQVANQSTHGQVANQMNHKGNPSQSPDLNVRRHISNSSLSNYLRTVPNKITKTKAATPSTRTVPKLSYTQRSHTDSSGVYVMDNYDYRNYSMKTPSPSALYGGYLPVTGRHQGQGFHVEIATDDEDADSVTVRDSAISEVESKSSGLNIRKQSPKRAILKTSFASRKEAQLKTSDGGKQPDSGSCKLPIIGRHVLKSGNS